MLNARFLTFMFSLSMLVFAQMACTKDRTGDDDGNGNGDQPTGLAADLDGEFEVEYIDFGGALSGSGFSAPIDSAGNGTEGGSFTFDAANESAQYDVNGLIKTSFLNQSVTLPVPVQGSGKFTVESNTRFTIDDAMRGETTFDVSNNTGDAMILSTTVQQDTTVATFSATLDMTLDVKIQRK
jgi:hypothetical protein